MNYNKPPKTYDEQLLILQNRGLVINDKNLALHCLEHCNYYRLSAYRFTLAEYGHPDQFLSGSTFEQLWELYCFDRQLRFLVTEAVKGLEISVRAHWAYMMGHKYGALAYEDSALFLVKKLHRDSLHKLDEELKRSRELFISHFDKKYNMNRPPIWASCEIMSFGSLSRFYGNMRYRRDQKEISRTYQLQPENLKSLLHHAVYIRNLCAHHSRLWNRRLTFSLKLPRKNPLPLVKSFNTEDNRRIYNTLVYLVHITTIIEPQNDWLQRLLTLINLQTIPVTQHMGFPDNWQERPIWQQPKEKQNNE